MSQHTASSQADLHSSSSFPVSSPSFWTEAAQVSTPPPPPSKRPRESTTVEEGTSDEVSKRARTESSDTKLSYLPSRADIFGDDDPHSYLANAEYAPNRFGDIGDYMRKKEVKVQTQNRDIALASAATGLPQIFAGVSFYINGNTHPPMEEIRKMILQRGGEVRPVLRSKGMVKFIIAPMLTQMKFKLFANYKVVREGWILESCDAGKLLDWTRWKLTVQGGWEESGRKGMEGFLKKSQLPTEDIKEEEPQEESSKDTVRLEKPSTPPKLIKPPIISAAGRSLLAPPLPPMRSSSTTSAPASDITPTKPRLGTPETSIEPMTPTKHVLASAVTLFEPASPSKIPISAGAILADASAEEKLPAKVHKAEGAWANLNYYSKESNEDAARLLKNQEWRLRNTAERGNEGGFIDGYYQNSRLHHLSTWKAELRVLVADAQKQSEEISLTTPSDSSIAPYSLANSILPRAAQSTAALGEKIIFHVDFDCFFVSCGLVSRPHMKGKPTVVCHSQAGRAASSTSEIASASYEARAKGVKNGMSLGRARALVGDELQTLPYEFDTYKKFSLAFYTVLMGYADELQAVSVDEALVDVTGAVAARAMAPEEARELSPTEDDHIAETRLRDPALELADKIRAEVRNLTDGCEVSIGISHNVLLAKLATRRAKPAGMFHLVPAEVASFLAPLGVEDFPSVGYSIKSKIQEKFETTISGDLLQHSRGALRAVLGPKTGDMVYGYLRGEDDHKLEPHKERKSISAEMNYGIRFQNQEQAEICVTDLAAEVSKRMKQVSAKGKLLTLKLLKRHPEAPIEPPKFLGHGWCETFNKSCPVANKGGSATDDPVILGIEAVKLLRAMKLDPVELRGVGLQITKLDGDKAEREVGQELLSFGVPPKNLPGSAKVEPEQLAVLSAKRSASGTASPERPTLSPGQLETPVPPVAAVNATHRILRSVSRDLAINADAGPSRPAPSASSEGIDPDFLAALPASLRQEVKRNFAQTRAASARAESVDTAGDECETSAVAVPTKAKGRHATAHITKQLRPKVKTHLTAAAVAELPLYGAWSKAQALADVVDVTGEAEDQTIGQYRLSELRGLGLDPEVFRELPADMQKEVVEEERHKHKRRKVLHRPADTSRLRARERDRESTRTASLSPSKSSRAGSLPPNQQHPRIAVSRPPKPTLLNVTALPSVLDTVAKWIESRGSAAPAIRDANKVKMYLVKCMGEGSGLGGVEHATEVLKWMRTILRESWEEEGREERPAGKEWWISWREMRGACDEVAVERCGARLRLD